MFLILQCQKIIIFLLELTLQKQNIYIFVGLTSLRNMTHTIVKTIKGKKYLYAEYSFRLPDSTLKKVSMRINDKNLLESNEIKSLFRQKEVEYSQKWALDTYEIDNIFTEEKIREFEAMRVGFKEIRNKLTKAQFEDLLKRFTANFTYESNAIEGNSLTLKDVTLLLFEGITPNNKQLREINETKNAHDAHKLLFEGKLRVNIEEVIRIHKLIVKNMDISTGWKKLPNFLVMRNVKTTEPEHVESEMRKLFEFYMKVKQKWHPLKIAANMHAKFEKIHPFEDGNGRVGRILLNSILIDAGYPPLIIRKTMRKSYFSALEASDNKHNEYIERFLIEKFRDTYKKFFEVYLKYI